jgi:hypothetical protein
MKNDGISYREFELEANRDPEKSYCPAKFGGFEWPDSKSKFHDFSGIDSRIFSRSHWHETSRLHCRRPIPEDPMSIKNNVSTLL